MQRYRPSANKTKRQFLTGFARRPGEVEDFDRLARFQDAVQEGRAAVRDARVTGPDDGSGSGGGSAADEASESRPDDAAAPVESSDAAMVRRRLRVAAIVVALLFVGLIGRAFSVQVVEHDRYMQLWRQSRITEKLLAVRGPIVDRTGEVYAITRLTGKSLFVVPRLLQEPQRGHLARQLASELNLDAETLHARFIRYADKQFVWVKRHLTPDEEETLAPLVKENPAVGYRDEMIRLYPQGQQLANVLGFVGADGTGLEGLELRFQEVLRGVDGERELLRDARGRRLAGVVDLPETLPRHGAAIELSIDHVIQAIAEDALDQVMENWKPKSCTALVMDPRTGEVLAMASRPTYDPGNRRGSTPEQWRNRVVADVFEPGSIFKPTIMMAALERGLYRIPPPGTPIPKNPMDPMPGEDRIFCENGAWTIREGRAARTLHDVHGYGWLPLGGVIIKSSNIGMAKVGRKLGHELLLGTQHELGYIARFGFGRRLGIDVPGEEAGFSPPKENYPDVFTVPSVTMGHSIGVTPLQVLTCFNQIANGGYILRPVVVRQATDAEGRVVYRRQLPQVIDRPLTNQAALDWMRQTLVRVCQKGGTATAANLDDYGISVAGKTGTAEKVVNGRYSSDHKVCSFLAFAPADNPVISVLVTVDEPSVHYNKQRYYGGTVAAPAVRDIVLRTLRQRLPE